MLLPDRLHERPHQRFVVIVAKDAALQMVVMMKNVFEFVDPVTQIAVLVTGLLGI
ncbi:hypothetical protein D3C87_1922860 [compost metagenome]